MNKQLQDIEKFLKNGKTKYLLISLVLTQTLYRLFFVEVGILNFNEMAGIVFGVLLTLLIIYVFVILILEKNKSVLAKNKLFLFNTSLLINLILTTLVLINQ